MKTGICKHGIPWVSVCDDAHHGERDHRCRAVHGSTGQPHPLRAHRAARAFAAERKPSAAA